jgi:transcription elongation factor GreB
MSKAFLRESDDAPDAPVLRPVAPLAPGQRTLLTPEGAARLRAELARLLAARPALVAPPPSTDAQRELLTLDHRIRQLEQSLRTADIVPPPAAPRTTVEFGAIVTVREPGGEETRYRLVGPDEADAEHGAISHQSPLARALLGATPGQSISVKTPRGPRALLVVAVS